MSAAAPNIESAWLLGVRNQRGQSIADGRSDASGERLADVTLIAVNEQTIFHRRTNRAIAE
jgi:hypothetical protein